MIIGPNARVDGPLVFEREVELYVHDSAKIGPVTGATAVRYDGADAAGAVTATGVTCRLHAGTAYA